DDLGAAHAALHELPPLVTSFEVERLKTYITEAQQGKRLLLQGGDCAETLADCRPAVISAKLKILLQMSLVLIHAARKPVIRAGRFAGQYAKPRSRPTETRTLNGQEVTLPSYFGDLVNRAEFSEQARTIDPWHLVDGYKHAAMTLNFIRSLTESGFADLHHPEYWDLSFVDSAGLSPELRDKYQRATQEVAASLEFMQALGDGSVDELSRVEFFTTHEGLNLLYESAQTRTVPRRDGWYCLTTHLPWIGERTRAVDGAHVEFFRGVQNPVGVKVGPTATADDIRRLLDRINPDDLPGKVVLITRMGASKIGDGLPPILSAVKNEGRTVLWVSDPMHGNTESTGSGKKTRNFDNILREVEAAIDIHEAEGTVFGGVHFELTGDDVTECIGGADGLTEADLDLNYATACDPRLNYRQALEMAIRVGDKLRK
ncbi:MAG: 3-deoxy-7-phosphoheptulonate synthase class II, partial [Myxococcota bacterium]